MARTHLIAVPSAAAPLNAVPGREPGAETVGGQIRRLKAQAQLLAREEMTGLAGDMAVLGARAAEMADGGDAYPPGVRELAGRIGEELNSHAKMLLAIMDRAAHA